MTIHFNKIETSQDSPITNDQIRLLSENNTFSQRYWNNQIFSCTWPKGDASVLTTLMQTAPIRFKANMDKLLFVFYLDGDASALDFDLVLFRGASSFAYSVSTGESPSGLTLVQYEFDCSNTEFRAFTDFRSMLSIVSANASDLFYFGLFAQYADSPLLETVSPLIFEPATDISLISIAGNINYQHEEKFLGGWMGTKEVPTERLPYTTPQFYLYHLYDVNDKNCGDTKTYRVDTAIDPQTVTTGDFQNYVGHVASSDDNLIDFDPTSSTSAAFFPISNQGVTGISYDTSNYSSIEWNYACARKAGTAPAVKGINVTASYPLLNDVRRQSPSGTAVDFSYYNIKDNAVINDTKINAFGQAQFNQIAKRAGNVTSFVYYDGYNHTLAASSAYAEVFYVPTYVKNHWAVNQYSKIYQYFDFSMIIKDTSASAYNLLYYFDNAESGDSTSPETVAMTSGVTKYISAKGLYLEKFDVSDVFDLLTLQMCTDNASTKTIEILSWTLSPMFNLLTY